jgi:hypothetical protein
MLFALLPAVVLKQSIVSMENALLAVKHELFYVRCMKIVRKRGINPL